MRLKKKNKRSNGKEMSKVVLGTLYDINKSIIENNLPELTKEEIEEKITEINDFIFYKNNQYYMLLCNERRDYTIFNLLELESSTEATKILLDECLPNRGKVKAIELTESGDAIEIWLSIDKESYCYYFFPYDVGVIEC